jgi:hypothetical protein
MNKEEYPHDKLILTCDAKSLKKDDKIYAEQSIYTVSQVLGNSIIAKELRIFDRAEVYKIRQIINISLN